METLIGTGGWSYYDVPGEDALGAYARAFPFVEVNSTFYEHPDPRVVASWRRRVPPRFCFSVRTHRDVTQRYRLRPTPMVRSSFVRTVGIARTLQAVAIVVETPASLPLGPEEQKGLKDLLASADLPCPVALEARAYAGRALPRALASAMESSGVADIVDFSRQAPRTDASIAYGRLFGLGEGNRWEFTNDELREIAARGRDAGSERMVFAFHGVRMYKDAARFLTFERTGSFPRATRHVGLASLDEVLRDAQASFPATGATLVAEHGWRVIDLDASRTAHAATLLGRLPARGPFRSASEVIAALPAATSVLPTRTETAPSRRGM